MPVYRIAGIRIPMAWILFLLPFASGCADTKSSANSLNASIGSPCGTMGVMATTGAGTVAMGGYGLLRSSIECFSAGPFYPLCVGAVTAASAATGLVTGLVDGIVNAPECLDDDKTVVASDSDRSGPESGADPRANVVAGFSPDIPLTDSAGNGVPPIRHTSLLNVSMPGFVRFPESCFAAFSARSCGV
jgi:hypothetical protein